jgi:hypothetical protein
MRRLPTGVKERRRFPNGYHDLIHDSNKSQALQDVSAWIDQRLLRRSGNPVVTTQKGPSPALKRVRSTIELAMNYRTLGKTGPKISEIGYGAWGIGKGAWVGASDDESLKAVHKSIDLGLNFIDTALVYGDGHSEGLVGRVVKERSERIFVATKIPPKNEQWPARPGVPVAEAFPAEHVISCTEASLKNIGLESIDSSMSGRTNGSVREIGSKPCKSERIRGSLSTSACP